MRFILSFLFRGWTVLLDSFVQQILNLNFEGDFFREKDGER